ncbi:MAG: HNH endonuclease [Pantoea sp.]|uniref:HNH endonuclease n=1 Tax=Pantoea sp. TaxID=69393 RepID=UPI002907C64C|nr:HNH endonuclease [Pantoea sp.]MDU5780733.1 HNH endonuclease [Pantoea sp.]
MNRTLKQISRDEVLAALVYHKENGFFTWKKTHGKSREGQIAGSMTKSGYIRINIGGQSYMVHRLVWLVENNDIPLEDIDHIDRDKTNNKITNLRLASRHQNMVNTGVYRNNSSGIKGVGFDKREGRWRAYICINYKNISLGYGVDFEDAVRLRKEAEKVYFDTEFSGGVDEGGIPTT